MVRMGMRVGRGRVGHVSCVRSMRGVGRERAVVVVRVVVVRIVVVRHNAREAGEGEVCGRSGASMA